MQHPERKGSSCVSSNDQEPQSGQSSQPSQSEQPEQTERRKPTSELWGPWVVPGENGQAPDYRVASGHQARLAHQSRRGMRHTRILVILTHIHILMFRPNQGVMGISLELVSPHLLVQSW